VATVAGTKNAKPEWFNPALRMHHRQEAREIVGDGVSSVFLALLKDNKIPSWVLREIDLKQIQLAVG